MSKRKQGNRPSRRENKRPHFYLDEQIEYKEYQQGLCRYATLERVLVKTPDNKIIKDCEKNNLHLITKNYKDFRPLRSKCPSVGVVWIKANETKHIISVLARFFRKHPKHSFYHNRLIKVGDDYKVYDGAGNLLKF